MEFKFTAQHRILGLSECERLCGRGSREIEDLASRSGWYGKPGEPLNLTVGTALNMLVLSITKNYGVELQAMTTSLPGLRDGALLELGTEIPNWSFEGTPEAERQFWPILYGSRDTVRSRIAPLLGCYSHSPTSELRFFSPSDIECFPTSRSEQSAASRTPRFTIDASAVASHFKAVVGSPVFTARPARPA